MTTTSENKNCDLITSRDTLDSYYTHASSNIKCKYINLCIEEILEQTNNNVHCENKYKIKSVHNGDYLFADTNFQYSHICVFHASTKEYYNILKNHLINLQKLKSINSQQFYKNLNILRRKCPEVSHFIFKNENLNLLPEFDFKNFTEGIKNKNIHMLTINKPNKVLNKDIKEIIDHTHNKKDLNGGDSKVNKFVFEKFNYDNKKIINLVKEILNKNEKIKSKYKFQYITESVTGKEAIDDFILKDSLEKFEYFKKELDQKLEKLNISSIGLYGNTINKSSDVVHSDQVLSLTGDPYKNFQAISFNEGNIGFVLLIVCPLGIIILFALFVIWLIKYRKRQRSTLRRQTYTHV